MHRPLIAAVFVAACVPALACAAAQTPAGSERAHPSIIAHANAVAGHADAARIEACTSEAGTLVASLVKGDFTGATSAFNDVMRANLGADKLAAVWQQVDTQLGKLQGEGMPQNVLYQGDVVVMLPLHFAKGSLNAQVACDAANRVAGFFLRPAAAAPAPSASR